MARYKSLDILRGLAAFCIMVYHFSIWSDIGLVHDAASFLGRIGLYGVSIFYVLSGLTMFLAYQHRLDSWPSIKVFLIKRIFRIMPLYWLACLGSMAAITTTNATSWNIVWNFLGLFGFLNIPSLTVGGWSIGNELVFYAFFPFLLWLLVRHKTYFYLALGLSILIELCFCFYFLNPQTDMALQWNTYINPFNQLFFFVVGIWLGTLEKWIEKFKHNQERLWVILLIICALFCFFPLNSSQTTLIAGNVRLLFSALSIALCFCFFLLNTNRFWSLQKPLSLLGEISYSVYLLHPICFFGLRLLLGQSNNLSPLAFFTVCILLSLLLSFVSYEYLEKPLIGLGKKVVLRLKTKPMN